MLDFIDAMDVFIYYSMKCVCVCVCVCVRVLRNPL